MFSALRSAAPLKQGTRAFSTSRVASSDMSRLTLIGRLGSDPVRRETTTGKTYYTYSVATATGGPTVDEHGARVEPPTSWHTVFAFGESAHGLLARVGKGSTVFVEADLEMRPGGTTPDGTPLPDRPLLRHQRINVINWVKSQAESEPETDGSDAN